MKRSRGDIRVIGMVGGTHVIEDLQTDVPYRSLVIIPEDQALMSKDLWRAISQGCLMQLTSAPYPTGSAATLPDSEKVRLEQYCTELESRLVYLQTENDALKRQLEGGASAYSAKLDEILTAIQAGIKVVPVPAAVAHLGVASVAPLVDSAVDGSAPTFLPREIVPRDLDLRINIQGEASTSEGVSDAADRLRRIRKNGPAA